MQIILKVKLNSKGKCYGTCPYRVIKFGSLHKIVDIIYHFTTYY